jgi:hypothetical protein
MNEPYTARLELFSDNALEMKEAFPWKNAMVNRLAALLYAAEDKRVDVGAIRAALELIKENTGMFSSFRGTSGMCIAALLSLSGGQQSQLTNSLAVFEMMKNAKFRTSDYTVVAAYQIAANSAPDQYLRIVERAKAFYDGMKTTRRFLTSYDDYIFAAMLGLSDIAVDSGVKRMEQLYAELKPEFFSGNSVQSLTQVLVLGEEAPASAARVLELREAFRARNIRMDKQFTLSSLGVLSLLPISKEELVNAVSETYETLRAKKGFGKWTVLEQELLLLSNSLVAFKYVEDVQNGVVSATLSTSITNIVIAQQTAITAAAAAAAAAASSS